MLLKQNRLYREELDSTRRVIQYGDEPNREEQIWVRFSWGKGRRLKLPTPSLIRRLSP